MITLDQIIKNQYGITKHLDESRVMEEQKYQAKLYEESPEKYDEYLESKLNTYHDYHVPI